MADHNGIVATTTMQDIVADADTALAASTVYLLENISNDDIYLSKQDSVPDDNPDNYNIIGSGGGRIWIDTGADSEAFVVWVDRLSARLSITEA